MIFHVRLVAGPFDGECLEVEELPERMWVKKCVRCGTHAHKKPVTGSVLYRRSDETHRDHHLYVFTDPNLEGEHPFDRAMKSEPATMGQ